MAEQRSAEWFAQRIGRVTGSNVGAILGIDLNRGPEDVMRAMVRDAHGAEREFKGNVATEYGQFHEDGARAEFQMETGLSVEKAEFVTSSDWLGASPDGYTSDGGLLEIKCPYGLRKAEAPVPFKDMAEQPHYYAQMQVQMHVTGRAHCHFFQWAPAGTRHEIIHADPAWLEKYLPVMHEFWERYKAEDPEPHLEAKRKRIDTLEAERLVKEYDELADAADQAKERMGEIKQRLIQMAGEQNADVCGRKLTRVEKVGAVSYAKVVKDHAPDVDLEPYRGKASVSWRFG